MASSGQPWLRRVPIIGESAIALASVTFALVVGLQLDRLLGMSPQVSVLLCAVMFVAWAGGTRAAIIATALAVLAFDYFFLEPVYAIKLELRPLPRLLFFLLAALFVVLMSAAYRRAADSLRRARDEQRDMVLELRRLNDSLRSENADRKRAEDALRTSEARLVKAERELRLTVDTIAAVVTCYRPDGERDFVNQTWRDYTGLTVEDIQDGRWRSIVHPDDQADSERRWNASLSTGKPFNFEQRLRRADGEFRWHRVHRVPLLGENGDVLRWYGIGFDIEDQKRAEAALRGSKARLANAERELQATVDTIPTLVARYSPDGRRDFVNAAWKRFTGLSEGEALGTEWSITVHPDDIPAGAQEWREALAEGRTLRIEQRFRRADGAYRWHMVERVPQLDDSGAVLRWYSTGYDIEDQKRAESALQRSEAYLAEAQKLSVTGSFSWAIASGEIVWSDETYKIMGCDRAVVPSRDIILQRTHPDDRELVRRNIEGVMQGAQNLDFQHRLLMPDGEVRHLLVRAHRVQYPPGPDEMVGALMDVTEARRAQEALHTAQADLAHASRVATLGEISASIAHEVNQPLAAIIANGQACLRFLRRETPDLNDVRGTVECMISDGNRASEVIRRLRGLMNKSDPQILPLDVNDVIREVSRLLQRELVSHRVSLRLALADVPAVAADRIQLQQVIINLVMNGVEAMRASEERELAIVSREGDDRAVVAVIDRGVGLSSESTERLFNAFFSTKPGGLGMGLSICRSIVESHGGSIRASANAGPGATFEFALPLHRERGAKHAGADGPSRMLEKTGTAR